MTKYRKNVWLFLLVGFFAAAQLHAAETVLFRENFENLDAWEPFFFQGIRRHTTYVIQKQDGSDILAAKSSGSASALVCKQTFDVSKFPIIRWRWKVDKVYAKGDYRHKSGDDYPLRVYVLFAYDPGTAAVGVKIKGEIVKAFCGRYPPHRVINYIWTNQSDEIDPVKSPFTDRSIMVPLQRGSKNVGRWVKETVNVLEDYQRFFGGDPPPRATLAIMNDSDNTGEDSTSYIGFIEVLKKADSL